MSEPSTFLAALARIEQLEREIATLRERIKSTHKAYLCNQGIPDADAEREAARVAAS